MTTNASVKFGNFVSPMTSSTANSSLRDIDSVVYRALDFFAAMINTHLGARYTAEVAATGSSLDGYILNYKVPYDPIPYLKEQQIKFPLLAVFRKTETFSKKTVFYTHSEAKLSVMYILPPLDSAQAERLLPFRSGIAKLLVDRTEQGNDPTYNDGYDIWHLAGLEEIGIDSVEYGSFPDVDSDAFFPALIIDMHVKERREQLDSDFNTFEGVDLEVDSQDAGTTAVDVADTATEL